MWLLSEATLNLARWLDAEHIELFLEGRPRMEELSG